MKIERIGGEFSVCKVAAYRPEDLEGDFCFIGKTDRERSLVCRAERAPADALAREDGWRVFRAAGPLDFSLTGILAGIASVLAAAGIPIFAVSTYDTDYVLVKTERYEAALDALRAAGYDVA